MLPYPIPAGVSSHTRQSPLRLPSSPLEAHLCSVCRDIPTGNHYGVLTCESCKAFFKRSVQQNKTYTCSVGRQCAVLPETRRKCRYCRFQKCIDVGMDARAVRFDHKPGNPGRNHVVNVKLEATKMQTQTAAVVTEAAIPLPPSTTVVAQRETVIRSTIRSRDRFSPATRPRLANIAPPMPLMQNRFWRPLTYRAPRLTLPPRLPFYTAPPVCRLPIRLSMSRYQRIPVPVTVNDEPLDLTVVPRPAAAGR